MSEQGSGSGGAMMKSVSLRESFRLISTTFARPRLEIGNEWDLWDDLAKQTGKPKEELTLCFATPFHGRWQKKYGGEWVKVGEWQNDKTDIL